MLKLYNKKNMKICDWKQISDGVKTPFIERIFILFFRIIADVVFIGYSAAVTIYDIAPRVLSSAFLSANFYT